MLALPFPAASFDIVTTGYGLRNVPDLPQAIDEIRRVLAPGGRAVSLDFNRPASAWIRSAYLAYLTVVGAALGWILHRDPDTYRYIPGLDSSLSRRRGGGADVRGSWLQPCATLPRPRRTDGHSPCHSRLTVELVGRGCLHAAC